jgi:hypothetical protein
VSDDSLHLGLVDGAFEGAVGEDVGEVEEGSGRGGDAGAASAGHVGCGQRADAVDFQSPSLLQAPAYGHVDQRRPRFPQAPQRRRRGVAERRVSTDGENGGDEGALVGQVAVPDRVDAPVEGVQSAGADPVADVGLRDSKRTKLCGGDDSMLPFYELRQSSIGECSTFR